MLEPQKYLLYFIAPLFLFACTPPAKSAAPDNSQTDAPTVTIATEPPLPEGVDVAIKCWGIAARLEGDAEYLLDRWCGRRDDDGVMRLDADVMNLLDFEHHPPSWRRHSKALQCYFFSLSNDEKGWGYVHKDGRVMFAPHPYDNECQAFGNNVMFNYVDGKAVFYDEAFNLVQKTEYVLVDGFYKHLSKVCTVKPNKNYSGEHFEWAGGQCGYIGTDYQSVVPAVHPYESTPRPTGGKYDGIEPVGIEVRLVNVLYEKLKTDVPIEAVFYLRTCALKPEYGLAKKCSELEFFADVPPDYYDGNYWLREFEFRLEDQTLWRGLVIYEGRGGYREWEREIFWSKVAPIKSLTKSGG